MTACPLMVVFEILGAQKRKRPGSLNSTRQKHFILSCAHSDRTREIQFQWSLNHSSLKHSQRTVHRLMSIEWGGENIPGPETLPNGKRFGGIFWKCPQKQDYSTFSSLDTYVWCPFLCIPRFLHGQWDLADSSLPQLTFPFVGARGLSGYLHSSSTVHTVCSSMQPRTCTCNCYSEGKNAQVHLKQEKKPGIIELKLCNS